MTKSFPSKSAGCSEQLGVCQVSAWHSSAYGPCACVFSHWPSDAEKKQGLAIVKLNPQGKNLALLWNTKTSANICNLTIIGKVL